MLFIEEMLEFNRKFVEEKRYEAYATTKYPDKKIAILSCMDTRLTEALLASLNLKNGDVKMIKNAGAVVSCTFDSVMRSLIIAVYLLGVENILVIGHHDCGMQGMEPDGLIQKMRDRNIEEDKFGIVSGCGTDIKKWLKGFGKVEESVSETVSTIKNHPLIPKDIGVYGFVIDPATGKLDRVA